MTALAREPFFRRLRARHPDVDIVILPPEDPTPPASPPLTPGQARTLVAHVHATLDELLDQVGHRPTALADSWPTGRRAEVRRFTIDASVRELADPVEELRRLGDVLLSMGWQARPTADDPPELEARRDELWLRATAYAHSVDLLVRTPYTRVTDATLRELAR